MRVKHITSRDNAIVKRLSELTKSASARRSGGYCLLEGEHLALSYVGAKRLLSQLVLREGSSFAASVLAGAPAQSLTPDHATLLENAEELIVLSPTLFDQVSSLSTPTGLLALASVPASATLRNNGFVLVLDAVQDPGNVGTLIRTAAAAGTDQVWLSPGCAFAWSTKTLRASQGAHFAVEIVESVDLPDALSRFSGACWATLPRALPGMPSSVKTETLFGMRPKADNVLVLSNEGAGLSQTLYTHITHALRIPMAPGVESLNVATAGALALYRISELSGRL